MSDSPQHLLLVEDNDAVAEAIKGLLDSIASGEWKVYHVHGLDAIPAVLQSSPIQLIVLDLNLDAENFGIVTLRRVLLCADDIPPIVVLTGEGDDMREPSFREGANGFATKNSLALDPRGFVRFLKRQIDLGNQESFDG